MTNVHVLIWRGWFFNFYFFVNSNLVIITLLTYSLPVLVKDTKPCKYHHSWDERCPQISLLLLLYILPPPNHWHPLIFLHWFSLSLDLYVHSCLFQNVIDNIRILCWSPSRKADLSNDEVHSPTSAPLTSDANFTLVNCICYVIIYLIDIGEMKASREEQKGKKKKNQERRSRESTTWMLSVGLGGTWLCFWRTLKSRLPS